MAASNDPSLGPTTLYPEDLWGKALGNLRTSTKLSVQFTSGNRREILEEVLLLVQGTERACQQNRWKWKNKKGETIILRDIFSKMVTWIEKFKGIGDNIIQYDPGHAALPWAAARVILQAAINDVQTNGAMVEGLELVFNIIGQFEVIERLYVRRPSSLQQQLNQTILATYTSILEFLLEANHYFAQRTLVRVAKSIFRLEDMTTKYISKITSKSNEVAKYVRLISGEIVGNTDDMVMKVDERLSMLVMHSQSLESIETRTSNVQDTIENDVRDLKNILRDLGQPITRFATQISAIQDNLRVDERLKIFEWLSTVSYMSYHRSKVKTLLPGSGKWLLQKPQFIKWMDASSSSILWLHGIPGSGKSMLVARVIEYIRSRAQAADQQIPLAYFYCARTTNEPERSDPVELMRSVVEQLSCSDADLPIRGPVVESYTSKKKEARGRMAEKLGLEECVKVLLELLETNPATIIIDGLDECDPLRRQDLLEALQTIINESSNVVQVFVSSRDDHDLVHRLSQTPNLYIRATDNMEDIEKFVISRVNEAITKERILCGQVSNDLKKEIIETLVGKANGMFRLASLHIDTLCDPTQIKTKANVICALADLPRDLRNSYDIILSQISNSLEPNPKLADRLLKWLLCSRESLPAQSLIFAVCLDMADQERLQRSDVLSICCNLVVYDEETDRFRFAHLSVQEYLERLESYSPTKSNALAAEQCLSWIQRSPNTGNNELHRTTRKKYSGEIFTPVIPNTLARLFSTQVLESFSVHADLYWGYYAKHAQDLRRHGRLRCLLQSFLLFKVGNCRNQGLEYAAWMSRICHHPTYDPISPSISLCKCQHSNPLFAVCLFDLVEIAKTLIDDSSSMFTARNDLNLNCAQIAARCNHVQVLRVILEKAKELQMPTTYLQEVIVEAALNRSSDSLKTILAEGGDGIVEATTISKVAKSAYYFREGECDEVFRLLFDNNSELEVNEEILEGAFSNDYDWAAIVRQLLKIKGPLTISRALFGATTRNRGQGYILHELLQPEFTLHPTFEITWQDITKLWNMKHGLDCLALLLEAQSRTTRPAILLLISLSNEEIVKKLLTFQEIEVTDDVIRAAAGNMSHGSKILRLLLEREAEEKEKGTTEIDAFR